MKIYLQIFFNLITLIVSAQQSFNDSVITPLQKNQLHFEKVFIHTNKTSYFTNDIIWFKAYVGDIQNKPSLKTTRLTVNLLNSEGKILQSKNLFINMGTGKGQFKLNDSLKSGIHYIQAYTNYMRNFKDNNSGIQELNVLNKTPRNENTLKNNYDVQIFPEGGYLLQDTENTIGIKALINGKGFDYIGKIVNNKNQEITSFKNEHLGMTKSKFFYIPNQKYTALIAINDTILKIDLPIAKKKGIVLTIDNTKADLLSLILKTNNNTIAELKESTYTLLFHQRNSIIDFSQISAFDILNTILKFDKKKFLNGVNTVTVFKDNLPILERKFYIEKKSLEISLSLNKTNTEKDSINYKLQILNTDTRKPITSNLSVSILPINALNFNETTSIKSSFLLSPYLKGYIENPAYYFNIDNSKRKEHLDLLLLSQGWTQYSLEEMINTLNPNAIYDFELGFKLNGTVWPLLSTHLALMTYDNKLIDKLYLRSEKKFSFNRLLIFKGDTVKISFLNNLNETIKPKNLYFDSIKTKPIAFINFNIENTSTKNEALWENIYKSGSIKLDEVSITGKKRSQNYYLQKKRITKYRPLVFDIGKYYSIEIPNSYKNNNNDLMSFLRLDQRVKLVTWKDIETYLELGVNKEAFLFIDGKRISSFDLASIFLNINDIEDIMATSVGQGHLKYQVFTTENYKKNITEHFNEYILKDGYDKDKKYYSPIYDFDINKHLNWTEIDWKPNVKTDSNGAAFFKIKSNEKLDNYLFSIQGFSDEGLLISEKIKL